MIATGVAMTSSPARGGGLAPVRVDRLERRPHAWSVVALAIVVLAWFGPVTARAEPVFPPGSAWGIEPPPGFKPGTGTTSFEHPWGATITVVSTTLPYDRSRLPAVGSFLEDGGKLIRIESVAQVDVGGRPGFLIIGRAPKDSSLLQMLIVQGDTAGQVMVVTSGAALKKIDATTVRSALMTARERKLGDAEKLETLPFRVSDLAGMRVTVVLSNQGVVLTDGPQHTMSNTPNQSFVFLFPIKVQPGMNFLPGRDEWRFADHVRNGFKATAILSASRRDVRSIPVIEVAFEKRHESGRRSGLAWTTLVGGSNIFLSIEAPVGQKPDAGRLERLLAGIAAK